MSEVMGSSEGASEASVVAAGLEAAGLDASADALDSPEELELHPARAIAETATIAAASLRLVFNVSPSSMTQRRHGARM
jgi:hypothetical protein